MNFIESIPPQVWAWVIGLSVLTFVSSLVVLPIVVVRMADDYFMPNRAEDKRLAKMHPVLRSTGLVLKNIIGFLLFVAGVIMIFTPGQGLLTILMGVVLMDFPGKRRFEVWLIRKPSIHKSVNWIRRRYDRPELQIPIKERIPLAVQPASEV